MTLRDGLWINDGGSELYLKCNGAYVTGYYITAAKRPEAHKKHPITGRINKDLIGFIVSWEEANSLTSWCGRYTVDKYTDRECIKTVWHLGRLFEDAASTVPNPVWSTFITNTCTYYFTRDLTPDEIVTIQELNKDI